MDINDDDGVGKMTMLDRDAARNGGPMTAIESAPSTPPGVLTSDVEAVSFLLLPLPLLHVALPLPLPLLLPPF